MNSERRLEACRDLLERHEDAAFAVTRAVNVAYLTGFEHVFDEEEAHAAVVTSHGAQLYTDSRYLSAARAAASDTPWEVIEARESVVSAVCSALEDAGVKWVGIESSAPHNRFVALSEAFRGVVESTDGWVEEMREIKSADEIARIAAAQKLTDAAFEHIVGYIEPGMAETQIALELEFYLRKEGSDGVAFPPIVASGPNSALPHAKVTSRQVRSGDFVKLDFGARVDGYCADMTRTLVLGAADARQREIYEAVLAANEAGIAAVRPGVAGRAVDAAARAVLEQRGFGPQFSHGLGHGVGMEVHELPSVGPRGARSIPLGSVITIEPGVYVPGYGGVRIEDLVVVVEGGARVLTTSPKGIIEL